MSPQYNQKTHKKTRYSCTIYTMLNIIKYDFGIEIKDDLIFKTVAYMEKIGVLLPKWAYFSIIYPAMCKYISLKTWVNLKVKEGFIRGWLDDQHCWWLWAQKLSSYYIDLASDWYLLPKDMDAIAKHWKGTWHNHAVKQSNKNSSWKLLESWGGKVYTTSLKALKRGVNLWIYWNKARTLVPADPRAVRIKIKCLKAAKVKWRFLTYDEFKHIASKTK